MRLLVGSAVLTGTLLVPTLIYHLLAFNAGPWLKLLYGRPQFGRTIRFNESAPLPTECDFTPPFRTSGARILDRRDREVQLRSLNWYGASDVRFVVSGLEARHRDDIARLIRRMGFNSVRLPYSDELVYANPRTPLLAVAANADLAGLPAVDVYHAVVASLTAAGLMVIPNNHITQATWCCGANLCDAAWRNDWMGPLCRVPQTEDSWVQNWVRIMGPLRDDALVVGPDLRNEVRGPWGTMRWPAWAAAAERAAEALLAINRDWLVFVEGVSSANDLAGVATRPVVLSVPDRVVYSAHVYAWSGWGKASPYSRRNYASFAQDMERNWAYLVRGDVAPVWVGELGTPDWPDGGDLNYWTNLMRYLRGFDEDGDGGRRLSWGYWAVNPRKPAGDQRDLYGLVADDWETVRWDYRMDDLEKLGLRALGDGVEVGDGVHEEEMEELGKTGLKELVWL